MNFTQALECMKSGYKVKLPGWGGYWCWDADKETIMMHCRPKDSDNCRSDVLDIQEPDVLDIRETQRVEYTFLNTQRDDWELADESNCALLGGQGTFNFSDALRYLNRGLKVARKGWNSDNQYIFKVDVLDVENYNVTVVAESIFDALPGPIVPFLAIKTNYNAVVPWAPSQTDILAEDWIFVD